MVVAYMGEPQKNKNKFIIKKKENEKKGYFYGRKKTAHTVKF